MIGVAQQAAVIREQKGRRHIQKLLELQIVVVPNAPLRQIPVVDQRETHDAMAQPGHGVAFGILAEGGGEGIQEVFRTLPLLSFGVQAGQCDLQNAALRPNFNALHDGGRGQVFVPCDAGGGVEQMPQAAGDPLRPKRRVRGQHFIVIGITLDIGGVERVQRIGEPGNV